MKINSNLISSENYSTNEKVVGKWDNGKPLYRKTFKITTANSTSWQSFNANISGLDEITDIKGAVKRGSSNKYWHPVPCSENGNGDVMFEFSINYGASSTTVWYRQGNEFKNGKFNLTLEYTKTTD